jgi:uncharacterized membrane protein YhiD involved in acid resistance
MSDITSLGISGLNTAARLLAAAGIGALVMLVHRVTRGERPHDRSLEQAPVLLCLAGALMMLIVGDSLPRAFGIAGAAAIVRFRTPVDDARDITVLFLSMALGMAAGLGLAMVAGVGTVFVSASLLLLRQRPAVSGRSMKVALVADGCRFPDTHVLNVFAAHQIVAEPVEYSHGNHAAVRYLATMDRETSIANVSAELVRGGAAGIASVSWEASKKKS